MDKAKNFILVTTLLVNTSQLFAQSSPQELINAAWQAMPVDLIKADSLSYQVLEMVNNDYSTPDPLYANTCFLLGTLELEKKRYWISADFFDRAIKTDFVKNNEVARKKCLNNMGASLASIGKIPEALLAFQEVMELSIELHDQTSIEDLWINIAELECELGEYEEAIAYAEKALEAAKEKTDTLTTAKCHLNLGKYFRYLEMYEEGEKNTLKASQLFEQLNDRNLLSAALINLSELEHLKENYQSSNRLLQRVIDISGIRCCLKRLPSQTHSLSARSSRASKSAAGRGEAVSKDPLTA